MAKWGEVDYREFKRFLKKVEKFEQETDKFMEDCCKELAARLLQMVIPRTPVGDYSHLMPGYKEVTGGTLRAGWTGGKLSAGTMYARSLPVQKKGDYFEIIVKNPTKYASYVEKGHRQTPGRYVPALGKKLKKGWVDGKFFLKMSEEDLRGMKDRILEKKLETKLREVFDD